MALLSTLASLLVTGVVGGQVTPAGAAAPSGYVPPSTANIAEFPLPSGPTSRPIGITSGPDGNLWLAEHDANRIARVSPSGVVTEFVVSGPPDGIVAGPDGNLWFTEPSATKDAPLIGVGKIGRITPDGTVTEWNTPRQMGQDGNGTAITAGPAGKVWFLERNSRRLASITPDGVITETVMPPPQIVDVVAGPDGNLWVFHNAVSVSRVNPTTGEITDFPLPDIARPVDATVGPDGNLWFTDNGTCDSAGVGYDRIWRMTLDGVVTEFPLLRTSTCPFGITAGPDGNLWFTQRFSSLIGRMTPTGQQTDIRVPTSRSAPVGITSGPDGKIWFTEARVGQVARLDPATITPPAGPCLVVTADTTLKSDVGPCAGDGIVVTGSNLTLNLNGHKVFANTKRYGDFAGIHLVGASGVTVVGGKWGSEVTGFDSGVWIDGGSGNTVRNLAVHDNISSDLSAYLGDGVTVLHSDHNVIRDNVISHNGVFDNVAILGVDSNYNTVQGNEVKEAANAPTGTPASDFFSLGTGIVINPFFELNNPRRGESVTGNQILANNVHDNANSGITNLSNLDALIEKNTVTHNGFGPPDENGNPMFPGNGIGVQPLFTAVKQTRDTVKGNTVSNNANDGIQVRSEQNQVRSNTATGNGGSGVAVIFEGLGNQITANSTNGNASSAFGLDLYDDHDNCDANVWLNNSWGSGGYFPDCVTVQGKGPKAKSTTRAPAPLPVHSQNGATIYSRGKPVGSA